MGAEQKISASAFTHRGEDYASNTGNFLLDGRQPFGFELDNSHVSVVDENRNFFFAVCDTKITDDLNTSVSGIKELKKLHSTIKTGSRDIKSNTEILGETFVGTEDLLYDTAGYSEKEQPRPAPGKPPVSAGKKPAAYGNSEDDGEDGDDEEDGENPADPEEDGYDGDGEQRLKDEDDDEDDDFDDEDERDYDDEAEDYNDVEPPADDSEPEPGKKGFSTAGFILSEKKGSILAQGDCEAFMFRGGALRVLSGGNKKVSVTLPKSSAAGRQAQQNTGRTPQPKPYGGRSSEIFEPREEDVYMLCTTSVVTAVGEENIDAYLSMKEDIATINSSILYDAVKNDPSSNMTCMLIRIDEIRDEEAAAALVPPARRGADYYRPDANGAAGAGAQAGGQGASLMNGGPAGASRPVPGGGRPMNAQPPYTEQETRVAQMPYQNRDAFSKRATSRFDAPPRRSVFSGNKSLITSIITTVALIVILILSYYFLMNTHDDNPNNTSSRTTTSSTSGAKTTTGRNDGDEDPTVGDDDDGGSVKQTSTSQRTTTTTTVTTTTTTEAPEQEYKVKSGDTLMRIAQRFYGNANAKLYTLIKERNNLISDQINIGDTLIIPPKPETTTEASSQGSDSGTESGQGAGTTAGRQSATTSR